MKKIVSLCFLSLLSFPLFAQYTVSGGLSAPYKYTEGLVGTGLEAVYVLNTLSGSSITYTSSAPSVKFYSYTKSLSDKVEITPSKIGNTYKVDGLIDNSGYVIEDNGSPRQSFWIFDYAQHMPILSSIELLPMMDESNTASLKLLIDKSDELLFYTTAGMPKRVIRKYSIKYNTLKWNKDSQKYEKEAVVEGGYDIGTEWIVDPPPLTNTTFTLSGDQFGDEFKIPKSITSAEYESMAVEAHIVAKQHKRDAPNEIKDKDAETELGGSAPVEIDFFGIGNEPVAQYYTWFIYNTKDMKNPIARYTDKDISYEFNDFGSYVVKLEVADANSISVDEASVEFKVTNSKLEIPNYFSPGDSPGSNDEFRVAYQSIIKFSGTIFNRWGVKLFHWTDPAKGWDGKYKGSYVNTGVYFYVIEALGADGERYKKGGDINILRSK